MSLGIGDNREILAYFYLYCKPFPFNLWRCGRLICFRLLFAVANNCLCRISDFENKFSVAICQIQQSTIATASLGLLKPAAVVRKRYLSLFIACLFLASGVGGDSWEIIYCFYCVKSKISPLSTLHSPLFYYLCTQWHNFSGNICYSRSWWRLWGWRGLSITSPLR